MHFSYWRDNHWDEILSVVYLFAPKCVTCERVVVRLLKWTFVLVTVSLWGLKPDWCWWLFVECLAGSDNKLISRSLDIISPHNLWRLYHSPLCPMSPLTTDKGRNAKWLNIWICVEFWDILRRINQPPRQWGRLWWWEGWWVFVMTSVHQLTMSRLMTHSHWDPTHTCSKQGIFRHLVDRLICSGPTLRNSWLAKILHSWFISLWGWNVSAEVSRVNICFHTKLWQRLSSSLGNILSSFVELLSISNEMLPLS